MRPIWSYDYNEYLLKPDSMTERKDLEARGYECVNTKQELYRKKNPLRRL